MQDFTSAVPEDMVSIAADILKLYPDVRILTLTGTLGSGKTTFTKALCKILGVLDEVSSPTYNIVNEYKAMAFEVYHFDLYRLKTPEELFEIGFEEYLSKGGYVIIEWPEPALGWIEGEYLELDFQVSGKNLRHIRCRKLNNE